MNQTELLKEIYEEYEEIVKNALKILAKYVSSHTKISAIESRETHQSCQWTAGYRNTHRCISIY